MARQKNKEKTVFVKVGVKEGLKERIDQFLLTPEGKVEFGGWMRVVGEGLELWLKREERKKK